MDGGPSNRRPVSVVRNRRRFLTGLPITLMGMVLMAVLFTEDHASVPDSGQMKPVPYSPPRTPWGDPDIQGAFTNTDERGIPMERPDPPGWFDRASRAVRGVTRSAGNQKASPPIEWEPTYEGTPKNSRRWLIVEPPDGKVPSHTSEVAKRRAATTARARDLAAVAGPWATMAPFVRCISRGMPASMVPTIYGNVYDITQAPGVVAIRYEMVNETRVIPLDGRAHTGPALRSYMGDARGRFDGDTLVVETRNFTERTPFWGSSQDLRLFERFTPISPHTVEWAVTLEDPATWTSPWTFVMHLMHTSARPLEFACHEGNYALRHMLSTSARVPGS